jgi:hypothetical protein
VRREFVPGTVVGWLIAGAALLCAAVPVVVYLWAAGHRIGYPYELDWLEGGTVELVDRVMHGHSLYSAPSLGYAGFTYTPLFSYVAAAVAEITGIGFLPLRIVSLASSLVSMAALCLYVRSATRDWVAGCVAAGLFAAMYGRTGWFFDVGRLDSLFLALALLALWLGRESDSAKAGICVGILGFLAFFTKQVGIIAVGPALLCAALARPRAGVAALATLVLLAGASTLILDALTHGWYRYYIVSELAGQPSQPKEYVDFWRISLYQHLHGLALLAGLGLLVLVVMLVRELLQRRSALGTSLLSGLRHPLLYDAAAAAGLLVSAWVSVIHSGSYLNVLMPAVAACAAIGGCAFGLLRGRGHLGAFIATGLVGLQIHSLVRLEYANRAVPTAADRRAGAELIDTLRRLPGPVLVLRHPWYGTLAGQGSFAQSDGITEILRSANARGRDALNRTLVGSLNRYHIQAVVLDSEPPPPWLAPQLHQDFTLMPGTITSTPLRPPADLRSSPTYLYVRRDVRRAG